MASAYGVGDFVWYEGREYQITDLQRGYVELLPPELPIPVYRTERRAGFERGLRFGERNRYITDYLAAELNDDAHEYVWSVLTPEDRAQISVWLRAGEGNTQVAERIAERLSGRNGAETDGLALPDTRRCREHSGHRFCAVGAARGRSAWDVPRRPGSV